MRRRRVAKLGVAALAGVGFTVLFWQTAPSPVPLVVPAEASPPPAVQSSGVDRLHAGTEIERPIGSGEHHIYRLPLEAGDALHVIVTQQQVDVAINLSDPQGRSLLQVDGPNGPEGPESLAVVAMVGGEYQLELTAALARSIPSHSPQGTVGGRYRLRVAILGPASERDRTRATAMELYARAERRRREPRATAVRAAVSDYREALDHFRRAEESLLEARTLRRIGQLLRVQGDVGKALFHYEQALELYRHHGNGWERAPLYNEAGEVYRWAGEPEQARELFERAIAVSRPLDHRLAVATAWNNLGVLHASLGEMQEALVAYDRALAEWQQVGNRVEQASALHNLGVHYISLGRLDEGLDFLQRALAFRCHSGRSSSQARTLTAIGWVHSLRGDFKAALTTYEEALRLRREVGDEQGEAVTLDQLGTAYLQTGQYAEALEAYLRALRLVRGNRSHEARTRINLGAAYLAMGRPKLALETLRQALEIFRQLGALHGQAATLASIARAECQLGRLEAARQHLEAALGIVESVRGRLQSRWLRSSYLAVRYDEYIAYIDLLMELEAAEPGKGHAARAFEASERARARTLLESLAEARAGLRQSAAPEILDHERALRAQINLKESRRMEFLAEGSAEQAAAFERDLRSLLLEYDKLQGEIRAAGPRVLSESRPLNLEEIRREVLDHDTLLLAYALGEERSFLWVVSRDSLVSHVLPPGSEIDDLARRVHQLMPRSHVPGVRRQASNAIEDLSQAVLAPAAGQLESQRLLIVGDGALHYVPFAALRLSPRAEGEGVQQPLLVNHEIVHLPSASVLALLRRELVERPSAPALLAVVADPVFELDDPRIQGVASGAGSGTGPIPTPIWGADLEQATRDYGIPSGSPGGDGAAPFPFERLPFASVEAEAILALAPEAESFRAMGLQADRDLILSGRLERYRIVHFATHGLLNARHPALSGLVLSLVDEAGRPRDGLVRLHEIFDLRLSADLVVLSACRTALGKEVRGEGLLGLTHGFFYAGAARLVVSFWSVSDRATAELMTRFYRGMFRRDLPPAQALRAAQLSMLAETEWQAPYYWAGFALQGEWR